MPKADTHLTMRVVDHIRTMIENGSLQPGDKIPPEREFARKLHISRASLRTGIGYLAAMGVMDVRHGVGTFVAAGPPEIGKSSLRMLGALHGFQSWQMFEARRILEGELAALAAERGHESHFAAMEEELAEMSASLENPMEYLIHDIRYHRLIAKASGNPILAALMETITSALYDERRKTAERSRNLREAVQSHQEIYRAIRSRDPNQARARMERHLTLAQSAQDLELAGDGRPSIEVPAAADTAQTS